MHIPNCSSCMHVLYIAAGIVYPCFANQCTDGSVFFLSPFSQKSLGEVRPRFPGENFGDYL